MNDLQFVVCDRKKEEEEGKVDVISLLLTTKKTVATSAQRERKVKYPFFVSCFTRLSR